MRITLHIDVPDPPALERIENALATLNEKEQQMNVELDTLTEKVAAVEAVDQSAVALLAGLKEKLDEAIAALAAANPGIDAGVLTALSARLDAQTQSLAAAIVANTPAAPAVEPAPVDAPPAG
jgi:ABC-type transporter Mla MlaB component